MKIPDLRRGFAQYGTSQFGAGKTDSEALRFSVVQASVVTDGDGTQRDTAVNPVFDGKPLLAGHDLQQMSVIAVDGKKKLRDALDSLTCLEKVTQSSSSRTCSRTSK